MKAVNQIDITMSRGDEHHPVPRCRPRCAVAGGITNQIGLRLDNGPAARPVRGVANEPMPEQCRRDHLRRWLVETPGQRPEASHRAPGLYTTSPNPPIKSSAQPGPHKCIVSDPFTSFQ